MEYWHTATPYQAQTTGWVGRFADSYWPDGKPNTIVNIAQKQSLAVQAKKHSPVVFSRPEEFVRAGDKLQAATYRKLIEQTPTPATPRSTFLTAVSKNASDGSVRVREAVGSYQTPVGLRLDAAGSRSAQGGGADQGRIPHARLLREPPRLRYPRQPGRAAAAIC